MKISELIGVLYVLQDAHGDILVYIDDPDTGWALTPGVRLKLHPNDGKIAAITGDYEQQGKRYLDEPEP